MYVFGIVVGSLFIITTILVIINHFAQKKRDTISLKQVEDKKDSIVFSFEYKVKTQTEGPIYLMEILDQKSNLKLLIPEKNLIWNLKDNLVEVKGLDFNKKHTLRIILLDPKGTDNLKNLFPHSAKNIFSDWIYTSFLQPETSIVKFDVIKGDNNLVRVVWEFDNNFSEWKIWRIRANFTDVNDEKQKKVFVDPRPYGVRECEIKKLKPQTKYEVSLEVYLKTLDSSQQLQLSKSKVITTN